jgi:tetratricopeptide (TPR) repeat protein
MGTRAGHLILGTLGVFLFMHPAWAWQEAPRQDVFEDGLRADSLMRQITPDRLEDFRQKAQREAEPRNWYDLGSALLLTGDWEGAVEPLQRAAAAADRRVDEPSAYNLGVAYGLGGRPEEGSTGQGTTGDMRRASLVQAREAFRRVLRENPGANDARWNLEVVDRWLEQLGGAGGGGGGDGGGGGGDDRPMTRAEADQLLDAVAAEERRVQEDRLERNRSRDPVAERNW